MDGRQRRRLGKQKQKKIIDNQKAKIQDLEEQIHIMRQVIIDQQRDLEAAEACHASPVLFDAAAQTDQLQCSHLK
eukprot:12417894-Karenia_brevis.AAC.1